MFYIVSHIGLKENVLYKKLRELGILIYLIHGWGFILLDRGET